jgi:predicted RNase H-like HicB family nuclease
MFKYSFNVLWSDEDNSFLATIREFPGLTAFGDTPEEAISEARIAAEGFIEVIRERGMELPSPIKAKRYSGQLRLRLPVSLHEQLSKESENENVSLNTYIISLLSERNTCSHKLYAALLQGSLPSLEVHPLWLPGGRMAEAL